MTIKNDMTKKTLPFSKSFIEDIIKNYPTPFHIYGEKGIRENAKRFYNAPRYKKRRDVIASDYKAFSWAPGFKNYFAVKANPNPYILKILKEEGMGADCSSLPELILAEKVGTAGEDIMFTSNDTPAAEFKQARELGAIINLDDIPFIN